MLLDIYLLRQLNPRWVFRCHLLAHLSQRLNVSYCDHWMSVLHCVSCIVNNWFKGHLLLNYWLDFDQTWQELSLYIALFNNCPNGFGPLHIYGKSWIGSYSKQIVFLAVYELMKIIFLKKKKKKKKKRHCTN